MNKEKIQRILSYQIPTSRIPTKLFKTIWLILLLLVSTYLFVLNAEAIAVTDDILYTFWTWINKDFFWQSYITLVISGGILYCLTGNLIISYVVMEIVTILWGIANQITYITRNQFISLDEIKIIDEAANVKIDILSMYQPVWGELLVAGVIVGVLLYITYQEIHKTYKDKFKKREMRVLRAVSIIIGFMVIYICMYSNQTEIYMNKIVNPHKPQSTVVCFYQSLLSNNVIGNVSLEKVDSIYNEFISLENEHEEISEKKPNIIVIMSEGFWDINNLEGIVESNENPMDDYYELTKESITGQIAVNIYGGGTNTTEFEFLTGLNTKYFHGANHYFTLYSKKQESMVSYLNKLGYYSMALHPYDGEFWHRDTGYSNMGFNTFYTYLDFTNTQMCHGYISDKALTQEIIDRFNEQKENNPEQPVFSFSVSVQNHVKDLDFFDQTTEKNGCTGINTTIIGKQVNQETKDDVEEYYNGMRETIEALKSLIEYFETYEEDTMIVFFGDHAPGFINIISDTEGMEEKMNLYRTPYMIWTNYENDYTTYGDINISYLSTVLIEYLEFPKPKQYYMNKYFLKNCPIDTKYEQKSQSLEEDKMNDLLNISYYISKHFPEGEYALPYWQIVN